MRTLAAALSLGAVLAMAGPAFGHDGQRHDGGVTWLADPWTALVLLAALCLYLQGCRQLLRSGRAGRALGRGRPLSFLGGIAVLALALVSPLDALAESLFSVHMTQHLLLMLAAPPLLVWGRPAFIWLWAFGPRRRKCIARGWLSLPRLRNGHALLMRPLVVWMTGTVALWFWHIPAAYDLALTHGGIHVAEHLCFFVTSLTFWTLVLAPYRREPGSHGRALVLVATFALHSGLLGALLTFAQRPLYSISVASNWGLTPLEDQQLAGLIMWVPASLVYLLTMAAIFAGWMAHAKAWRPPWSRTPEARS